MVIVVAVILRRQIAFIIKDRETFRSWLQARGAWAEPIFILIQFAQVVIFVIPGEITQIAGGFAFGALRGLLWSVLGITAGSAVNYYVARLLGRPFIEAIAGRRKIARFNALISSARGEAAFFLFFLIPGIPKDALCYVAGLSRIGFPTFFGISLAGRLPGIAASALMGDAAGDGRWILFIVLGAASLGLFALGLLLKDRLHDLIERLAARRRSSRDNAHQDDPRAPGA
jgi:uncharacterized membrane protein YdjX (TVP38/TMEM64 family)